MTRYSKKKEKNQRKSLKFRFWPRERIRRSLPIVRRNSKKGTKFHVAVWHGSFHCGHWKYAKPVEKTPEELSWTDLGFGATHSEERRLGSQVLGFSSAHRGVVSLFFSGNQRGRCRRDYEDESQEKRRKVRKFEHSFTSREFTSRHVQVVSNYLIGKTLHQNPKKRPTSAEFVSMMQLCDPEFCMEQIEDVADRSNPGKVGRAKSLIGDQTTQNLVERAWVGRKADVRRVTDNINNWKDHILSSLLQRSERRRAEDSGSSGSNNARPLTRSQKRRAARERRQKESYCPR